jgi:hypothetical protein
MPLVTELMMAPPPKTRSVEKKSLTAYGSTVRLACPLDQEVWQQVQMPSNPSTRQGGANRMTSSMTVAANVRQLSLAVVRSWLVLALRASIPEEVR